MMPSKSCLKKDNSLPRQPAKEGGVRFEYLTILEFPITLGDTVPREGPPIAMADKATRKLVIHLDRFEAARPERRDTRDLFLDAEDRTCLLLLAGFSMHEVADAALEACRIRVDREHNAKLSSKQRIHKVLDTTRRTLKSMVIRPIFVQHKSKFAMSA
jgi:hypothetical protein